MLGLTATPRDEVNRDTYQIFDLEQGNPTFAYELDDAIRDGHLVSPTGIDVPFKFLRSGIKYSALSPDERAEYEEKFADPETGEIPDEINAAALNQWLFNGDTIDQALEVLMERGIMREGQSLQDVFRRMGGGGFGPGASGGQIPGLPGQNRGVQGVQSDILNQTFGGPGNTREPLPVPFGLPGGGGNPNAPPPMGMPSTGGGGMPFMPR